MEQEERDRLHKLEYHITGNGGMGLLQRISFLEETLRNCSETVMKAMSIPKCDERYTSVDKRLDALEDAQMVSKLEMETIVKNAMEKTFNKKADTTWKIFNLLFGGGVIFAILKAVGVI